MPRRCSASPQGELVNALMLARADGDPLPRIHQELLQKDWPARLDGQPRYILAVTDQAFKILAATPERRSWKASPCRR